MILMKLDTGSKFISSQKYMTKIQDKNIITKWLTKYKKQNKDIDFIIFTDIFYNALPKEVTDLDGDNVKTSMNK